MMQNSELETIGETPDQELAEQNESLVNPTIVEPEAREEVDSPGTKRKSSKKKDKKIKNERSEFSKVVFGILETKEIFGELLQRIGEECGPVRSTYYRENQKCGFAYFHDEETALKAKNHFHGTEFHGQTLKALAPLEYFDDEKDALPTPPASRRRFSETPTHDANTNSSPSLTSSPQPATSNAGEPACTLVLKNLSFGMQQDALLQILSQMNITPQSVNYHYDRDGMFCGMAFAKYKRMEDATRALDKLSGKEIHGRKLKVEYKRRMSLPPTSPLPPQSRSSIASNNNPLFDPSTDPLDLGSMEPEQRHVYAQLQRFKDNPSLTEISLHTPLRPFIHLVADALNLYHMSQGAADSRYVVVSKIPFVREPSLSISSDTSSPLISTNNNSTPTPPRRVSCGDAVTVSGTILPPSSRSLSVGSRDHALGVSRERFAQPKGPDNTKGFTLGRGRKVSSLLTVTKGPSPPRVTMRDGGEFTR